MVFAHQGGWDEIAFALTPLVIVGLLLRLANRRANAAQLAARTAAADAVTAEHPDDPPGDTAAG